MAQPTAMHASASPRWAQAPLRKYVAALTALFTTTCLLSWFEFAVRAVNAPEWLGGPLVLLAGPVLWAGLAWWFAGLIKKACGGE